MSRESNDAFEAFAARKGYKPRTWSYIRTAEAWQAAIACAVELLDRAPSTPEKAGGVSPENQYFGDLMILQVLADSDCPNDQEREVLLRWIEHSQPPGSPIPHPLPAQANDGGEHHGS